MSSKKADKRDDVDGGIWSVDRVFEENDTASSEGSSEGSSESRSSESPSSEPRPYARNK